MAAREVKTWGCCKNYIQRKFEFYVFDQPFNKLDQVEVITKRFTK